MPFYPPTGSEEYRKETIFNSDLMDMCLTLEAFHILARRKHPSVRIMANQHIGDVLCDKTMMIFLKMKYRSQFVTITSHHACMQKLLEKHQIFKLSSFLRNYTCSIGTKNIFQSLASPTTDLSAATLYWLNDTPLSH